MKGISVKLGKCGSLLTVASLVLSLNSSGYASTISTVYAEGQQAPSGQQGSPQWGEKHTRTSPPVAIPAGMAFDSSRRVTVLVMISDYPTTIRQTWEYDGGDWYLKTEQTPGDNFEMVYDSSRQTTVAFNSENQTWEYDGNTWGRKNTPASPDVGGAALAFDSSRGRVVLFGGSSGSGSFEQQMHNETWEYDGFNWTLRPTANAPSPRVRASMIYDSTRERIVLFGGLIDFDSGVANETWEYDGSDWTRNNSSVAPPPVALPSMAYDSARSRTVLFGGGVHINMTNETWEYDGSNWYNVPQASPPSPRYGAPMVYDSARKRMVLFGGTNLDSDFNDTWEYVSPPDPPTPTPLPPTPTPVSPTDTPVPPTPTATPMPAITLSNLPIVLVHGWRGNTLQGLDCFEGYDPNIYFDGLPAFLEGHGFSVFSARLDTSCLTTPRVEANVRHVKSAIEEARRATNQDKVIVIAHSMGGLAARAYIEGEEYQDDVLHLFTFGTPHLGVNISTSWYGILGAPPTMSLQEFFASQAVMEDFKYDRMSRFNQEHPRASGVTYHLVSGNLSTGRLSFTFGDLENDGVVPTGSGTNLDGTIDRLTTNEEHGGYFKANSKSRKCLTDVLVDGKSECGFVSTLTTTQLPPAQPKCRIGDFLDILLNYDVGKRQAEALGQFCRDCVNQGIKAIDVVKEAVRRGIKVDFWGKHSPATILVTNQAGQRTGVLEDGVVVKEIPDSDVLIAGDEQFVFYPADSGVIMTLKGTGTGTMTVEMVTNEGANSAKVASYVDVPVIPDMVAQSSPSDPEPKLSIDTNADGRDVQTRLPDQVEEVSGPGTTQVPSTTQGDQQGLLIAVGVAIVTLALGTLLFILMQRRKSPLKG